MSDSAYAIRPEAPVPVRARWRTAAASISEQMRQGMVITASDTGPGIPDIDLAMRDGYSTAQTLGAGLPGVRRLADQFAITSEVGVGTTIRAVKWLNQRLSGQNGTTHNE